MKYTKIIGSFLNFQTGQKLETGIQYASQEIRLADHQITIETYVNSKVIRTILSLDGTDLLDFKSKSDDPRIPVIKGRFLNSDYEESIFSCLLTDKSIEISGVVSKIDKRLALSTKTLTAFSSGKVIGVEQESIELISESVFKAAVRRS